MSNVFLSTICLGVKQGGSIRQSKETYTTVKRDIHDILMYVIRMSYTSLICMSLYTSHTHVCLFWRPYRSPLFNSDLYMTYLCMSYVCHIHVTFDSHKKSRWHPIWMSHVFKRSTWHTIRMSHVFERSTWHPIWMSHVIKRSMWLPICESVMYLEMYVWAHLFHAFVSTSEVNIILGQRDLFDTRFEWDMHWGYSPL